MSLGRIPPSGFGSEGLSALCIPDRYVGPTSKTRFQLSSDKVPQKMDFTTKTLPRWPYMNHPKCGLQFPSKLEMLTVTLGNRGDSPSRDSLDYGCWMLWIPRQ